MKNQNNLLLPGGKNVPHGNEMNINIHMYIRFVVIYIIPVFIIIVYHLIQDIVKHLSISMSVKNWS